MSSVALFTGSIPANYDKYLGPVLFEPYALDLIVRLKNELACGTGRVTKHLVDLIPGDGRLVSTDLNPGMLEIAQSKIQSNKLEWKIADAQHLPFEKEQFDHIVCQFGVMFFPDKGKAFREAYRILKPGGKYLFNTWESVEKNPRTNTIWNTIKEVFKNDAPEFFHKGPYSFNDAKEIEQLLITAGFRNMKIDPVSKTPKYNQADDLVTGFIDGSSLYNYLKEKDEKKQQYFRKLLKEKLEEQDKILGNTVPSLAFVVEATK